MTFLPKSQQWLLAFTLFVFILNIIAPVIGIMFNIEVLDFSSIIIKCTQGLFIIMFVVFTYRQIKRKGFKP
ncbi:hypothetical protein BTJ66_12970 [Staphylococcus edaphicus]|uniref:Uncharacterized protein n=1 Tax=Staphylococcus edaphicus TaxID=1955013 RepID=A0A2C6WKF7_9STAP|nr:hypothetical protein BTJ66_12970 [Staphylococcus edaphicus]